MIMAMTAIEIFLLRVLSERSLTASDLRLTLKSARFSPRNLEPLLNRLCTEKLLDYQGFVNSRSVWDCLYSTTEAGKKAVLDSVATL